MSARLARSFLHTSARRAQTAAPKRVFGRRNMASEAHAPSQAKSDLPWIVGSTLIFGPMLVYLMSPSARKSTKAVHHDAKEHPTSKTLEHPAPVGTTATKAPEPEADAGAVLMADDEGKVEDIATTLAVAEQSNVPKAATSPEEFQATLAEASSSEATAESTSAETQEDSKSTEDSTTEESTVAAPGPTDVGVARVASVKGESPKDVAA